MRRRSGAGPRGPALLLLVLVTVLVACDQGNRADRREREPREGPSRRARTLLADPAFDWRTLRVDGARVHYLPGTPAARDPEALALRVSDARRAVLDALDLPSPGPSVDVFYAGSRAQMERLAGAPVAGQSWAADRMIAVVLAEGWRGFERHELAHVLSRRAWGDPAAPAAPLLEGVATWIDGTCGGFPLERVVRTMQERDLLLPVSRLLSRFRAEDDLVAYLQAASLVDFLVGERGRDALRETWLTGLAVPFATPGEERRWQDWVDRSFRPIPAAAWERVRTGGCGVDAASGD